MFNRTQTCVADSQTSSFNEITCGVPQGSILGPILFLLYFNDFNECLSQSRVINFADDTVVFLPGKCFKEIEEGLFKNVKQEKNIINENENEIENEIENENEKNKDEL